MVARRQRGPVGAWAQERVRRIGVLLPAASDDAEFQTRDAIDLDGRFDSDMCILGVKRVLGSI